MENKKYKEVIWYGRGGQGAITASQLIAEAAHIEGYKGITTAPSFGAERRGAPVAAFLRLSQEPIRIFSQISDPDVIVVLDPSLLPVLKLKDRYNSSATVIINSRHKPEDLDLDTFSLVGTADVTHVALENNLTMAGIAILNTPILGAFVKTTELVSLASVEKAVMKKFSPDKARINMLAAKIIYDSTVMHHRS
ncbi:MAG TPA: 2-oxoacid:acceptor oxidoreductase family protein [Spirochaetota bacterium]|nr:2-oxoacid:acceptor oxidoreductase family protein [Spirochaetota bacterium]HPI89444.1 2-oxoacid:acceptor oxidoreductase family protein [Spirochaetota bacterium]HPR46888.1 2-oxoacid:acceptor oxidoreductase family protein [Spirochaetota bacterium]